jgi:hypothetical protein
MTEPTSSQRAELLIRRLEHLIRDGKESGQGMSFKTWQSLAFNELNQTFLEHERYVSKIKHDLLVKRLILTASSTLVTIGFWGSVVYLDRHFGMIAAVIVGVSLTLLGIVVGEIIIRKTLDQVNLLSRERRFSKIRKFDDSLKEFENELWVKTKKMERQKKEIAGEKAK